MCKLAQLPSFVGLDGVLLSLGAPHPDPPRCLRLLDPWGLCRRVVQLSFSHPSLISLAEGIPRTFLRFILDESSSCNLEIRCNSNPDIYMYSSMIFMRRHHLIMPYVLDTFTFSHHICHVYTLVKFGFVKWGTAKAIRRVFQLKLKPPSWVLKNKFVTKKCLCAGFPSKFGRCEPRCCAFPLSCLNQGALD